VYSFLDMLGDIGGLSDAVQMIFSVLVSFISSHLFIIDQVKRIFKARNNTPTKKNPWDKMNNA
jgi:hypothetical protein